MPKPLPEHSPSRSSFEPIRKRFARLAPPVEFCSLRSVREERERVSVRRGVLEPVTRQSSIGAMVSIAERGGSGYAATSDLSEAGLAAAIERAREWCRRSKRLGVVSGAFAAPRAGGEYRSRVEQPVGAIPLGERIGYLQGVHGALVGAEALGNRAGCIVDSEVYVSRRTIESSLVSDAGAPIEQRFELIDPGLRLVVNEGTNTQTRSYGFGDLMRQGGWEQLERVGFAAAAERVAAEAIALLGAEACPHGQRDLLIMPSQMILQIHESIGHPLELDRILGDERNYAGGSFVTPDMFGSFRYGSPLLNVVFDPSLEGESAGYAFDDEGTPAEAQHLIRDGILVRPLGGTLSQLRSHLGGVAAARACDWNRPPIDRMANLNLLPGEQSLASLIASIERGILVDTNRSWSIDDRRNKFQFGCEYARLIRGGELAEVVRDASYRGLSQSFWRSLSNVGGPDTVAVLGTPYCGKGEPNQVIHVGHAAPACVFRSVSVFGS